MIPALQIGTRSIGVGHPCFIIAEAGVNHNGDIDLAKKLIDAAKEAGADAIKFQTFHAENLVTPDAKQAPYQLANLGKEESQYAMLKRLELSPSQFRELAAYASDSGIIFLSTPFSEEDADVIEELVPAYKIPSGEITNIPYLLHMAQKRKPIILSTGMSSLEEVQAAVDAIYSTGNRNIVVLHSTSNYPPSDESINLNAMLTLGKVLDVPVGYSDNGHGTRDEMMAGTIKSMTGGTTQASAAILPLLAPIIAVALGACVIEKHFTLDKTMSGPDHKASLSPSELMAMVQAIRKTQTLLGSGEKKCTAEELANQAVVRKSLVARVAIHVGTTITQKMLTAKRPGTGISPASFLSIIGRKTKREIMENELISWEMVE